MPPFVDRADIDGRPLQEVHQLIAERARSYPAGLLEQVHTTTVPVASECVESDEPHRAILEAAERLGCDLIVMASHGRRGLSPLLLGSETQKVLTHANRPVLVWRPPVAAG